MEVTRRKAELPYVPPAPTNTLLCHAGLWAAAARTANTGTPHHCFPPWTLLWTPSSCLARAWGSPQERRFPGWVGPVAWEDPRLPCSPWGLGQSWWSSVALTVRAAQGQPRPGLRAVRGARLWRLENQVKLAVPQELGIIGLLCLWGTEGTSWAPPWAEVWAASSESLW